MLGAWLKVLRQLKALLYCFTGRGESEAGRVRLSDNIVKEGGLQQSGWSMCCVTNLLMSRQLLLHAALHKWDAVAVQEAKTGGLQLDFAHTCRQGRAAGTDSRENSRTMLQSSEISGVLWLLHVGGPGAKSARHATKPAGRRTSKQHKTPASEEWLPLTCTMLAAAAK